MSSIDVLIKGGRLVDATHIYEADIAIAGEKIAAIGKDLESVLGAEALAGAEIVDAAGRLVTPGFIDSHTHMDLDVGFTRACDDWFTGTRAALAGGTTTVCDHMAFGPHNCTLMSRVETYHSIADDKALCDFKLHGIVATVNDERIKEMEELKEHGINTIKIYMTYADHLGDEEALKVLRRARELGQIVCVHAENHEMVETLRRECAELGHLSPHYHATSRPVQAEAEAIDRILHLASLAGDAPIYIVHLTTAEGLEVIKAARARGQKNIFAETCPQYLTFTDAELDREDGLKFVMSPPLRKESDIKALWEGLAQGHIQVIGTDHCPFTYKEQKQRGKDDFRMAPNGAGGVEERIMAVARGVEAGYISWPKLVETCATNPAEIFGLAPHKGYLQPGADADLVIFNGQAHTLTQEDMHGACDYTCYEGIEVPVGIDGVWLRGKRMVDHGTVLEDKGYGKYTPTGTSPVLEL